MYMNLKNHKRWLPIAGICECLLIAPTIDANPFTEPVAKSPEASVVGSVGFPNYLLVGVAVSGARKIAVIKLAGERFRLVEQGDMLDDLEVTAVSVDSVTLYEGETKIVLQLSD